MRQRMQMPTDKHMLLMQSLETNVAAFHELDPTLTDYDVNEVYDAFLKMYKAQTTGRSKPEINLKGRSETLYKHLSNATEILLDKPDMLIAPAKGQKDKLEVSAEDLLGCFKRLQSSLKLWTKEGGRQGYLNYISQFV